MYEESPHKPQCELVPAWWWIQTYTYTQKTPWQKTIKCYIWSVFIHVIIIIIIIRMQCNLLRSVIWESIAENNHSYKNIFLHTSTEWCWWLFKNLYFIAPPPTNWNINNTDPQEDKWVRVFPLQRFDNIMFNQLTWLLSDSANIWNVDELRKNKT